MQLSSLKRIINHNNKSSFQQIINHHFNHSSKIYLNSFSISNSNNVNRLNKKYYCSYYYDSDDISISSSGSDSNSFGYNFKIEVPLSYTPTVSTSSISSTSNTIIKTINNSSNSSNSINNNINVSQFNNSSNSNNSNNNNVNSKSKKITPKILDTLPQKIKISRSKKTTNNNNNNNNNNSISSSSSDNDNSINSTNSNSNNDNNNNNSTTNNSKKKSNLSTDNSNNSIVNNDTNENNNSSKSNVNNIKNKTKSNKNKDSEDSDLLEIEDFKLTEEQERIIDLIVNGGKNVFFTGSAGTGKSFILQRLVLELRKKYPKSVYITAATGIAAVNIGGTTLHSFAGIKLGKCSPEKLAVQILQSKKYCQRWIDCKVLIIDEISMIDSELFEKLDIVAKTVRDNQLPFGGIQLVLLGDFYQLPPVYGNYAFESQVWNKSIDVSIELTKVMRQKDPEFINILNKLRVGKIFDDTVQFLISRCQRPLDITNGVLPTKLYSTNKSVDQENQISLDGLSGDPYTFESIDSGHPDLLNNLDKDCPAPSKLVLKIGAQVVLLRKLEKHNELVNGSRGVVVGFVKARAKRRFSSFYEKNVYAPVVLFNNGQKVTIPPNEWAVWSEKKASRVQLPLKLAWALTIHRAQGMTLDKVECELSKTFAHGQGYVALSRVKSLDGLYLKEFKKSSIKTSQKVVNFNKVINK